ncbi:juvenile hormone esterase-like [Condylostylus longicornis]|uniref:juvenile hormone esterase-like n=1 Tax=Condylostylus longicornis TaxID=2530218 RepID=UPI00244E3FB8|nr:juvenile hormone esterase-like [Condylostylus longicornis]XP_055386698.1 juvenile hormone esterase-like [Condylostylus longicornis]
MEYPIVSNNKTRFIGKTLKTWTNENFHSFRGIRYAVPPTGTLRFKDPVPYEYDDGEYDATEDGHDCYSIYATNPSEDCLNLNVYTQSTLKSNLAPVIAFIHPGGLYVGSALSNFIGPEYLMNKNIVLVTFNYRLGTLGFLNIGTKEYPGNAGFKDQVIALRWINKNIINFGGDPNNITLMGYSAGGVSICLHIVSPMSKGLFHRAIIMSGSIPPQSYIPKGHQRNLALRQVKILGCNTIQNENETKEIIEFLNTKSALEISMTLRKMFFFGKDNPMYLWLPIIENDYGQERFLTDAPYVILKSGNFMKIPILIGFTDQEFGQSAYDILSNDALQDEFNRKFQQLAPICFMYELHQNKDIITNEIHKKLLLIEKSQKVLPTVNTTMRMETTDVKTSSVDINQFIQLCNLFSDSIIKLGASKYATEMSKFIDKIYRYKFTYRGRHTNLNGNLKSNGAEHMDDLWYLFKMKPSFLPSDPEADLIDRMVDFFTSFAFDIDFQNGDNWKFNSRKYMEICGTELIIKNDENWFNEKFYEDLFQLNCYK